MLEHLVIQVLFLADPSDQGLSAVCGFNDSEDQYFKALFVENLEVVEARMEERVVDILLLDLSFAGSEGTLGIRRLCQKYPSLPVVALTEAEDYREALVSLREGAQDFFLKSKLQPHILRRVMQHAIERKRVDVALSSYRERLRESQRLEMLGRLSAKVAHDFKNILAIIIGYTDLVLEVHNDCAAVEHLKGIKKAGKRGLALTSRILSFSRREAVERCFLDLNAKVLELVSMMGCMLPDNVAIATNLASDLPPILAASGQVNQILANLILNSKDAMPTGGTIIITTDCIEATRQSVLTHSLSRPDHYLRLCVKDTGMGMSEDTQRRIFDPFFTTKPAGAGTGLGVAVVDSVMKGLGGAVEVSSTPGIGTTFCLYFPVFTQELPEVANKAYVPLA